MEYQLLMPQTKTLIVHDQVSIINLEKVEDNQDFILLLKMNQVENLRKICLERYYNLC